MHATIAPLTLIAALLAGGAPARAADRLPGPVPAHVLRVIDGDTLMVRAHIWIDQQVTVSVRLLGLDAPELKGRCARERSRAIAAREALGARAPSGSDVRLVQIRYDKYAGRVLARVIDRSGADIGKALLKAGHVRPYGGRKRAGWCEGTGAG